MIFNVYPTFGKLYGWLWCCWHCHSHMCFARFLNTVRINRWSVCFVRCFRFSSYWFLFMYFIVSSSFYFLRCFSREFCAYVFVFINTPKYGLVVVAVDCADICHAFEMEKRKRRVLLRIRHDYANCSLFIKKKFLANDSPISIEIYKITILLKAPSIAFTRFFFFFFVSLLLYTCTSIEWMAFRLWEFGRVVMYVLQWMHACVVYAHVCECVRVCGRLQFINWNLISIEWCYLLNKEKGKPKKRSLINRKTH